MSRIQQASISLVLIDSTDGEPHWGQRVKFDVSTAATGWWVHLLCYQNGVVVAEGWKSATEITAGHQFGLYSPEWTGGDADCTAEVVSSASKPSKILGSVDFHVFG